MGALRDGGAGGQQRPAECDHPEDGDLAGFPGILSELAVRSGAFVPLAPQRNADQVLILCRTSGETFTASDLEILA